MPVADDLATSIDRAWATWMLREQRSPAPHASVYASSFRTCRRRMVYDLTVPDQQPPFDAAVLARFRRGNDRERDLLVDLARIGRDAEPAFEIVNQQERFVLRDRKGRAAITGKVDARVKFSRTVLDPETNEPLVVHSAAPLEVKAWSPMLVDRIERFEDLFSNPWTQSGGYQLLSYLYGANEPFGLLLLDRSGLPRVLPVDLNEHWDRVEDFLSRAEQVLDHVDAGTLPPFLDDAIECKRCPYYGRVCNPPLAASDVQVLTDPELEPLLEQWHELKDAGHRWRDLDAALKQRLRGVDNGLVGHFAITGRWSSSSRLELPADLKKLHTVKDPRGRFTLTIDRL